MLPFYACHLHPPPSNTGRQRSKHLTMMSVVTDYRKCGLCARIHLCQQPSTHTYTPWSYRYTTATTQRGKLGVMIDPHPPLAAAASKKKRILRDLPRSIPTRPAASAGAFDGSVLVGGARIQRYVTTPQPIKSADGLSVW